MLFTILSTLITIFELLLIARVLMSWFPNIDRNNPIIRVVYDVTEPVLQPIRNALPQTGMIDFSPLIVFVVLQVLRAFLRI